MIAPTSPGPHATLILTRQTHATLIWQGDHWASSIAAKRLEAQKKEDAAGKGKKSDEDKGSGEGSSAVELTDSSKDGLLNQVTEEMRSMRNHFVVVTLIDLAGTPRQEIVDPVRMGGWTYTCTCTCSMDP